MQVGVRPCPDHRKCLLAKYRLPLFRAGTPHGVAVARVVSFAELGFAEFFPPYFAPGMFWVVLEVFITGNEVQVNGGFAFVRAGVVAVMNDCFGGPEKTDSMTYSFSPGIFFDRLLGMLPYKGTEMIIDQQHPQVQLPLIILQPAQQGLK